MNANELGRIFDRANESFARAEGVNQARLEGAASPFTPIESK